MRITRNLLVIVLLMAVSAAAGSAFTHSGAGLRLFADVQRLIGDAYIETLDPETIYERAAQGLVAQLGDPYSELYPPADLEEFTTTHMGRYGGVGMEIQSLDGFPVVNQVFPETPAEGAGLQAGDRIFQVDEAEVGGWALERVTERLRGEPGSGVAIRVRRAGRTELLDFRVTRAVIHVPPVPYSLLLEDEVGYVPLVRFWEGAAPAVQDAVEELLDRGARSIVLDLRGNGGGLMDEAVAVSSLFLQPGDLVVAQRERERSFTYRAQGPFLSRQVPVAVLVDEGTASASEIVAGALQDYDRAVVVGERTFGKGVVQSTFRLDGGYMLKLTTGSWHTPLGRSLDRPRTLVAGRLQLDTSAVDTAHVRSRAGRLLLASGGVTPDLVLAPDSLDGAAQAFLRAVTPRAQSYLDALSEVAEELKEGVRPDFVVESLWRERLYAELEEREVGVSRPVFDEARAYVDVALGSAVARASFGRAAAKAWAVEEDAALVRAVDLLRGRTRQADVLAAVDEARGR
ncbi:MAG TPA: S41 family peptidase [Longimicrobiales bacterium]|nr:S41 family peptidase [Longimicrobiales bacterium]